ncbi:MAG: glycosyltransferase family 2 protein [Chloroflexi bacterium]|nr:glycosyltransferase family 2 protein [Chloroflexota bacterium]
MSESISIIIPAYNDEGTVAGVVGEAVDVASHLVSDYEIFVINDGSRDDTGKVLEQLKLTTPNLRVAHHEVNRGFGATIRELYLGACKEFVFSSPGDGQIRPGELRKLWPYRHDYDLIIGQRQIRNDPWQRRFQSLVYNMLIRLLYGVTIRDVNSVKLFRRSFVAGIILESTTPFVDAELCIRVAKQGGRLGVIPIEHKPREYGRGSGGKFSVIWETFRDAIIMWPRLH